MIVVRTDLSGPIMVPDIVIIDLRKRDAEQSRDQEDDSQQPQDRKVRRPSPDHAPTSLEKPTTGNMNFSIMESPGIKVKRTDPCLPGNATAPGSVRTGEQE